MQINCCFINIYWLGKYKLGCDGEVILQSLPGAGFCLWVGFTSSLWISFTPYLCIDFTSCFWLSWHVYRGPCLWVWFATRCQVWLDIYCLASQRFLLYFVHAPKQAIWSKLLQNYYIFPTSTSRRCKRFLMLANWTVCRWTYRTASSAVSTSVWRILVVSIIVNIQTGIYEMTKVIVGGYVKAISISQTNAKGIYQTNN